MPIKQKSRRRAGSATSAGTPEGPSKRLRILEAAFAAFMERGYSDTSTLEIATRARVSKRELYALVGDKQDMLIACITERAGRMRAQTAEIPQLQSRGTLQHVLEVYGLRLLSEVTHPTVVSMHRLAIAEANRSPEVARALQSMARQPIRAALRGILLEARSQGLLAGDPADMTEQFLGLLWGDLMMNLLLGAVETPGTADLKRRAGQAARALLLLDLP